MSSENTVALVSFQMRSSPSTTLRSRVIDGMEFHVVDCQFAIEQVLHSGMTLRRIVKSLVLDCRKETERSE